MPKKPKENKVNKTTDTTDTLETKVDAPDDQRFDNAFDNNAVTLDNKNIQAIIEVFTNVFTKKLGNFWGKRFEITSSTLKVISITDIMNSDNSWLFANFSILNQQHHGLFLLQKLLLNSAIDYLFGSEELSDEISNMQFGECSLKVTRKIATFCLEALQNAIEIFTPFQGTLLECGDKPKSVICTRYIAEKSFQFTFELSGMSSTYQLALIIPESQIECITFQSQSSMEELISAEHSSEKPLSSNKTNLLNELSDVSVDLIAVLPEVKLNLAKIMSLKKGDLIPIGDPQQVELRVGDRRAYKAMAGQSNAQRIVKITERIS